MNSREKQFIMAIMTGLVLLLQPFPVFAGKGPSCPDAPHDYNSSPSVGCLSCHMMTAYDQPNMIPPIGDTHQDNIDDTRYNRLCWGCHDYFDTVVNTHSSVQTSRRYGDWTVECWVCHNQHYQDQLRTYGASAYIYTGASTAVDATSITVAGTPWDPGEYEKMVVVPDISNPINNYYIDGNNENTISVVGVIDLTTVDVGDTLGIIYGNLIRTPINLDKITDPSSPKFDPADPPSKYKNVKFFNNSGANSFADGDSVYDGVCQVCHTETNHFRNTGEVNVTSSGYDHTGTVGTNCIDCHSHENGFAHGAGGGTGCISCHGHDAGYEYESGKFSQGNGTAQSHSTHTEDDSDDIKGPEVLNCEDCHDVSNFPRFKDGNDLANTTVCDTCHSKGGSYDGIDDPVIGAKTIWRTGAYVATDDSTLRSGKEKWCAGCHDDAASQISGVDAPNVIGNESEDYIYGNGWGYYKTGHGLPGDETYPSKGGIETLAGRAIECDSCHDFATAHIDGEERTFGCGDGCDPAEYRQGYRLQQVGGEEPMEIPWTGLGGSSADKFRICTQAGCHGSEPFTDPANTATNFYTWRAQKVSSNPDVWENYWENRHEYHLNFSNQNRYPADYNFSGTYNSRITCVNCHNVHGSTQLAMVRDGKLIGREPGLKIWYDNPDVVSFESNNSNPPDPENLPLSASTGTIWRGKTSENLCTHCHANNNTTAECRDSDDPACSAPDPPFQPGALQPPVLDWTGENGYIDDGVDPDNATEGSTFVFRVKYTDVNNDAPALIQVWIDSNDINGYEGSEKYPMVETDPSDINYTDGKIYTFSITLQKDGDNTFDYRFYALESSASSFEATGNEPVTPGGVVIVSNNAPILSWTGEEHYESLGVYPPIAKSGENFTFKIKYTDFEGDAPSVKEVWIDANENGSYESGEKHDMTEGSGDYKNGMIYSYSTTLSYVADGTIDYTFRFNDGSDDAGGEAGPLSDNVVTVVNSGNNPPMLSWVTEDCFTKGVKPIKGLATGDFTFKVKYTDLDNQCPPAADDIQVVVDGTPYNLTAGAGSCDTGRIYSATITSLPAGTFDYSFTAYDGTDTATFDPAVVSSNQVTVVSTANAVGVRTGTGDSAPWYNTIQDAVDVDSADLTILVYEGTYSENVWFDNVGGTDEGVILESVCGPELTIISASSGDTVFMQNITSGPTVDGFTITGTTNSNGIGINNSPLTVKNSIIKENNRGINSSNPSNVLTVENTVIENNSGNVSGAGINLNGGGPHSIADSVIRNNTANSNSGGGLFVQNVSSGVTIIDTTITGNESGLSGGGIYFNNSVATAERVSISSNTANTVGGGVFLQGGLAVIGSATEDGTTTSLADSSKDWTDPLRDWTGYAVRMTSGDNKGRKREITGNTINTLTFDSFPSPIKAGDAYVIISTILMPSEFTNSNITDNTANTDGGGLYIQNTTLDLINSTVSGNSLVDTVSGTGGGLWANGSCAQATNSIFWANEAAGMGSANEVYTLNGVPIDFVYSDIPNNSIALGTGGSGSFSIDETNLEVDPLFVDSSNGDYHLKEISPMIDQGTSSRAPVDDIDGDARPQGSGIDIGSDEYSTAGSESEPPEVTGFAATTPSGTLSVPITLFTATDNVRVTGYNITTSVVPPTIGGAGWSGLPPTTYLVSSDGTYDLYPWARDAAGNVSAVFGSPQTVVVDSTGPEIAAFTATNPSTSLNIPITAFTASDGSGVTGYQITTSSSPPSAGGGGWTGTPPTTYTVGSDGSYTLYPWAKDTLDNVSSVFGSPRTVVVDTTPPQVSSTDPTDTATGIIADSAVTINWDENVDCSTVSTSTITIDAGGWTRTSCSGSQAVFAPDSQGLSTTYTVTVSTSVKDVAGNPLASNYQFSYTTGSGVNSAPTLDWATANCLVDGVKPRAGETNGDFEFRVVYSDSDGQCPPASSDIQVVVNGTPYDLTSNDGGSCTTGREYYRTITLSSAGTFYHYFTASDGIDSATGNPTLTNTYQVSVINADAIVRPSGSGLLFDYNSIDAAWDAATSNDIILVYPNDDYTAATYIGQVYHWTAKTGVTLMSACGPDLTIASGNNAVDYVFRFQGNDGVVIDGFSVKGATNSGVYANSDSMTIRNCKVHDNPTGIYPLNTCNPTIIENSFIYDNTKRGLNSNGTATVLTISDTEFTNNGDGTMDGAALYCKGSGHTFTNLTMTGNDGRQGGAIFSENCDFTMDDSVINNNTSVLNGGGAFYLNIGGSIILTDTFIQGNSAIGVGGAIYTNTGDAVMTNVMITGNKASGNGGAIFSNNGYTDCTFCTISGNYAGNFGGGVYIGNSYTSTFKNSIIYNNDALNGVYKQIYTNYRWSYADVYSTLINQSPGSGSGDERLSYEDQGGNDTTSYPSGTVFVSREEPVSAPTTAGDYRIKSSSPCVDTGSASYTSDHDIYGDSRPVDGPDVDTDAEYDMGADEYIP